MNHRHEKAKNSLSNCVFSEDLNNSAKVKQEEVVVKIVARKKISILFCPKKKKKERKTEKRRTKKSESGIGNGNNLGGGVP
jgi:CRISPR/Cas system-associated endoribonuclease Cas2